MLHIIQMSSDTCGCEDPSQQGLSYPTTFLNHWQPKSADYGRSWDQNANIRLFQLFFPPQGAWPNGTVGRARSRCSVYSRRVRSSWESVARLQGGYKTPSMAFTSYSSDPSSFSSTTTTPSSERHMRSAFGVPPPTPPPFAAILVENSLEAKPWSPAEATITPDWKTNARLCQMHFTNWRKPCGTFQGCRFSLRLRQEVAHQRRLLDRRCLFPSKYLRAII